jgi:hypothetical protein
MTETMLQEILTFEWENTRIQYYVRFTLERNKFIFNPALKYKSAPKFTIVLKEGQPLSEELIPPVLLAQATHKVREILSNNMFDKL